MRIRNAPLAMSSTAQNGESGRLLRQARQRMGLSQERLAPLLSERLGLKVSGSQLSYYESGAHALPAAVLIAMLELIGVPLK